MNPQVISTTETVDFVFFYIFGISAVMLIGIAAAMIYFVIRYHRKRNPHPTSDVSSNIPLEVVWTLIPTILVMGMFYYGWAGYLALRNVPEGAMEVKATGRMWSWTFTYANGKVSDKLFVPVDQPVRVDLVSEDVLHSFFIPAFRVKRDVVPGMENYLWFSAPKEGSYDIFCAEYCGVAHADMITTVEAVSRHEFEEWIREETATEEAEEGRALLSQYGCLGCHSLDGTPGVGPTFKDLFGRSATVLTEGRERTITVDAAYLKRAILHPAADVVKGFQPIMPSYQGRIPEHDLEEIIEYFEKAAEPGDKKAGAGLVMEKGCTGCHSTDGSRRVGPSFLGLFGRQVSLVREGKEALIEADEEYLRRAIRQPAADLVKGYPPVMPAYADLSEEELQAIIDYLKSLR